MSRPAIVQARVTVQFETSWDPQAPEEQSKADAVTVLKRSLILADLGLVDDPELLSVVYRMATPTTKDTARKNQTFAWLCVAFIAVLELMFTVEWLNWDSGYNPNASYFPQEQEDSEINYLFGPNGRTTVGTFRHEETE